MRALPKLALISAVSAISLGAAVCPSLALAQPPPAAPPSDAAPAASPDAPTKPPPRLRPDDATPPVDPVKLAETRLSDLVKHGTESCAQGDVDEGLPALRAAWALRQDAELAITLANCEIKATDFPAATDHLAFALRNVDDPAQRKALEASFLSVRARVGGVKLAVNVDGADVFVADPGASGRPPADRFVGTTPLPGEVYVQPGMARIYVKKPGYGEVEGRIEVAPQGTATLSIDLAGRGASSVAYRPGAARSRTPAIVLGVIGLVGAGIGASLFAAGAANGGAADNLLAELQTTSGQPCAANPPATGCQTLQSLRSSHDNLVNAGTGVLVGSGAVLGAAVIYGLWASATPPPTVGSIRSIRSIHVAPSVAASRDGGQLLLQGSF